MFYLHRPWQELCYSLLVLGLPADLSLPRLSILIGPRVVFRMTSDLLRKAHEHTIPKSKRKSREGGLGNDEIGHALKVLLHLSSFREGVCSACRDDEVVYNSEIAAFDVLGYSYYAGKDHFSHRYGGIDVNDKLYHHKLGINTICSFSNLVRSSLGTTTKELFREDTARTWIDAANMLLDECLYPPLSSRRASSGIPDATAMAVVIIVVVFFDVPSSQKDIVRSIYDRLTIMTSFNSHDFGRKRDQSCFLLVSVLVWSLCAKDR